MKQYRMLFVFIALMMAVSLACNAVSAPTAAPTTPPTKVPSQPQPPAGNPPSNNNNNNNSGGSTSSGSSDLVTFTDKNDLMAFDLPGDWTYENGSNTNYYYDTFTSPAGDAKIENLVYNDGTPFVASQNGKFALGLLHNIYSSTGKEGDIKVTDDAIQGDGSERLTWESKGGGYSGVSFFELRGNDKKTFMMFTAWWNNDVDQATLDIINNAISSYHIP